MPLSSASGSRAVSPPTDRHCSVALAGGKHPCLIGSFTTAYVAPRYLKARAPRLGAANQNREHSSLSPPRNPGQRISPAFPPTRQLPTMAADNTPCYDALIVGAGVAGCALARALSRQGRNVLVLERSLAEPDRIVGELLQPGGVEGLIGLGLDECLEGIEATPVKRYHLY